MQSESALGKGYVHVYTGPGKGKTTSALGLVVRACGAGLRVFLGQFLKSGDYSELAALRRLSEAVTVRQYGTGKFVRGEPSEEDRAAAREGFREAKEALASGRYQMVVLDEANVAVSCGLLRVEELLEVIGEKPDGVELVITGRGAHPAVVDAADLVTEMAEIKHYYQQGVPARRGVEK